MSSTLSPIAHLPLGMKDEAPSNQLWQQVSYHISTTCVRFSTRASLNEDSSILVSLEGSELSTGGHMHMQLILGISKVGQCFKLVRNVVNLFIAALTSQIKLLYVNHANQLQCCSF